MANRAPLVIGALALGSILLLTLTKKAKAEPLLSGTKTAYLFKKMDVKPIAGQYATVSFVPKQDISIVGVSLEAEIYPRTFILEKWGDAILRVELSKADKFDEPGSILNIRTIMLCFQEGDSFVLVGDPNQQASIVFPVGREIKCLAGEPIYMNIYAHNDWAYTYSSYAYGTIYYI